MMKSNLFLSLLCVLFLGGCTQVNEFVYDVKAGIKDSWPPFQDKHDAPPPPQTKIVQTADGTWLEPAPAPNSDPVEHLVPAREETDPAVERRIVELERDMHDIRKKMSRMRPANLSTIETKDIKMAEAGATDKAPVPAPVQKQLLTDDMNKPQNIVSHQKIKTTDVSSSVQGIRFGVHRGGKTRIVLDMSAPALFMPHIDEKGKTLTVSLPDSEWKAETMHRKIKSIPAIESYTVTPGSGVRTILTIVFKKPMRILKTETLKPSQSKPARIVIDVGP